MGHADYLTAVEAKLRWERTMQPGKPITWPGAAWSSPYRTSISPRDGAEIEASLYFNILRHAEITYVSPKFCNILDTVVPSMPDMTLTKTWVPSPYGFIYFGREISLPLTVLQTEYSPQLAKSKRLEHLTMRAMGWIAGHVDANGKLVVGDLDDMNMIQVVLFQEMGMGFHPLSFFYWRVGESLFSRIIEYESEADRSEMYSQWETHEMKYFCALLNLMDQRIFRAAPTKVEYDRPSRRRLEKEKLVPIPEIKVVMLRRYMYKDKTTGVVKLIEWDHQWPVIGHWRQQWYPTEQAYRPKFIMPYIKGPKDKPFKDPSGRLFAVVR